MTTSNADVTLDIGGAKLTVAARDLFRAWLDKHIGAAPAAPASAPFIPVLKDGEHYAGIILGKDGATSHHLILLPGEVEDTKWQAALDWAVRAGGELPTRREQSLLFANLKEQFTPNWYWSSEQHSANALYAWLQYFSNGNQIINLKGGEFRARAVRRLVIF